MWSTKALQVSRIRNYKQVHLDSSDGDILKSSSEILVLVQQERYVDLSHFDSYYEITILRMIPDQRTGSDNVLHGTEMKTIGRRIV